MLPVFCLCSFWWPYQSASVIKTMPVISSGTLHMLACLCDFNILVGQCTVICLPMFYYQLSFGIIDLSLENTKTLVTIIEIYTTTYSSCSKLTNKFRSFQQLDNILSIYFKVIQYSLRSRHMINQIYIWSSSEWVHGWQWL